MSNDKSKRVNVLVLDKDAKVSTVTSLSYLQLRGQRSKKGQITKCVKWQKLTVSICWCWANMHIVTKGSKSKHQTWNFKYRRLTYLVPLKRAQDLVLFFLPAGALSNLLFLPHAYSDFLSFWQHSFFTYFPTSDFDQIWIKVTSYLTTTQAQTMVGSKVT